MRRRNEQVSVGRRDYLTEIEGETNSSNVSQPESQLAPLRGINPPYVDAAVFDRRIS
jgi:hypothetical protein